MYTYDTISLNSYSSEKVSD